MRNPIELEKLVGRPAARACLIVGDLILDRYVSGDVTRISPEAPIPDLDREERPRSASAARATSPRTSSRWARRSRSPA
jgi:D-beta-D-heptose 7-phosphate kinase/D-beta-D-heptose 1-phosphate adenosyltransferase